ncbi:hypothetical protein GCM10027343_09700 [Noviherbaspirillum agri]
MDCPWYGRQTQASQRGAFKRLGTHVAQMAVASGSIVKDFDVIEHIPPGFFSAAIDLSPDALLFVRRTN